MKIKIFLLAFAIISAITNHAQTIRVIDKSDLQPISQVNIANGSKTIMVTTDETGSADITRFSLMDTLYFSHVAFQSLKVVKQALPEAGQITMVENIIRLDEFVVSANREEERKSTQPYKIEVIRSKDVVFQNPQNSAIMLEQTGQVFVQTSQLGGGSPVLRGFEANKVLLIVDGIRLNNAIYRAGHLQNAITVDPLGLSTTEILYGPGSTIYGSDALGGVINFRTKDPILSSTGEFSIHGDVLGRFSSADNEKTGGINLNVGWKKLGVLLNFSYSDFDDLRMGRVRNPAYGDFGDRNYYAERIDGKDSTVANYNTLEGGQPWIQKQSGYSQYNFLGKVLYSPGVKSKYILNFQYSNSSDIPRYDRLTEMKNDSTMKYSEWYYGPQTRLLASLNADYTLNGVIVDHARIILGYQHVNEDRIQRDFGSTKKKYNLETVDVFSMNADLDKKLGKKDDLSYGIEFDYNNVGSDAYNENINIGENSYNRATRYADEKASMMYLSAYASNNWKINDILNFSQGLRFNYVTLDAAYSDTMVKIMNLPYNPDVKQSNAAVNGYLGLTAAPGSDWKFSLIGSSGFRAPNVDDLTKFNITNGQTIVVPNPDLKPEYSYNLEVSIAKTILGKVRLEGTGFYTWMHNAQVVSPGQYNGKDSIDVDGDMYQVTTVTNAGRAHLCGIQASLLAQVTRSFSIVSNLTYTYGFDDTDNVPLDHIPPVFGMTSFRLELKKFKGDFYVVYNGWKRISQYSPSGEDNQNYALILNGQEMGMPSWYTLNLKLSYQIIKYLNVELGMENILDENYRKFASGISAPGRNVIVALRATL
jgi:hemoglobin/transferrin/lactoferrin receptor protein